MRCVDCGLDLPVELMEPIGGARYRCLSCEDSAQAERRQVAARRGIAIAGPLLGALAIGAGLPTITLAIADPSLAVRISMTGTWVLSLAVGGLLVGAAACGVLSIARTLRDLLGEPTLPTADRVLLPLGGIAAISLAALATPLVWGLWAGPMAVLSLLPF